MQRDDEFAPLNAIRVFVAIAREQSVTRAAETLAITQSAASRHLKILETYLGRELVRRRGRYIELTEFGRLYFNATADALDSIHFTTRRMRQSGHTADNLVVRTSLPTFAYSTLIPNIPLFSAAHDGASVDVVTSLVPPSGNDRFDVLITRDLEPREASDQWELLEERLICVGAPSLTSQVDLASSSFRSPILAVTSRPDILPRWTTALGLSLRKIKSGPRYDHHFLAIPAAATGQGLLVAPEILVADLLHQRVLAAVPHSSVKGGMHYSAYAIDRTDRFELARSFCQWLVKLCRAQVDAISDLA